MSDITELFNRDPLSLTNEDIDKIIAHYRENRKSFNANPGAVKGKKAAPKKLTEKEQAVSKLNIDGFNL